ncbi:hypothetical protein ZWY2020_053798 [Hordeum vulgare]|nr:hypothetical protein ZWY2020_053798 [Hordeum vulgare]
MWLLLGLFSCGHNRGIVKLSTGKLVSMLEQELVDCDVHGVDQGCEGGEMDDAFKFIIKNGGLTSEANYPYTAQDGQCKTNIASNSMETIKGYEDVPTNDESFLMKVVANQPVSVVWTEGMSYFNTTSAGETSKFCGCLQQILNRQESGRTIEEKTNDAHILFKEMDPKKKKPFTLMHCYIEFSKYPKWQTRELETSVKKQKKTIDASPGTATNDPADASSVRTDATSIRTDALEHETRPDGVKKDKRGKADDIACKFSLETVWAAKQEKDEIKEAARNARYAQQLELRKEEIALKKKEDARNEREDARRQFELDERVMLMDTSGMTDAQKQFYQAKQKEILARGLE